MTVDELMWIEKWYESNCDGDWEHSYGVKIETLDNPGWSVKIDTNFTPQSLVDSDWEMHEQSNENWFGYKVVNGLYDAAGDPHKLQFILAHFRKLVS